MRILHISKYLPDYLGGIEAVVKRMAEIDLAAGREVTVIGMKTPKGMSRVKVDERVKMVGFRRWAGVSSLGICLGAVFWMRKLREFDVVVIHSPNPWFELLVTLRVGLERLWFGRRCDVRLFLHSRVSRAPSLYRIWEKAVLSKLLRAASVVASTSPQLLRYYRKLSGPDAELDRIKGWMATTGRIFHLVPLPANDPTGPRTGGVGISSESGVGHLKDANQVHVLALGRLVSYKGYDVLIRALAQVKGNWALRICGKGPEEESLKRLAADLGVDRKVVFVGEVTEGRKETEFRRCDIFVAPSTTVMEGFGLATVEAFSHAKAAVLTRLPTGVSFLARNGRCGGVAEPGDAKSLRACIQRLLESRELRDRCGRENRKFYELLLNPSAFKERYLGFTRELARVRPDDVSCFAKVG